MTLFKQWVDPAEQPVRQDYQHITGDVATDIQQFVADFAAQETENSRKSA